MKQITTGLIFGFLLISTFFPNGSAALSGITAYYPFDDMTAHDAVGPWHGQVNGSIPCYGVKGNAFYFDGVDDYISIPNCVSDDFSIVFWVQTTQTAPTEWEGNHGWFAGNGLVDAETCTIINDFGIALLGNNVSFGIGDYSKQIDVSIESTHAINDGSWHQIAAVRQRSSGNMKLYVDGVLEASGVGSTNALNGSNSPPKILIGNDNCDLIKNINWFQGKIDDVQIYSRTLTKTEIQNLYKNDRPTAPSIASLSPNQGFFNLTIPFSVSGKNFQNGTVVNFTKSSYGNITWIPSTISKNKITGTVFFPVGAPLGKWDLVITVPSGMNTTKKGGFELKKWEKPKITSITPKLGYQNTTIAFTLSGSTFHPGATVNFSQTSYGNITADVSSATLTTITGNLTIPPTAPIGNWNIIVTTPDGGQSIPKSGLFTVKSWSNPVISSMNLTSGYPNMTYSFLLNGDLFKNPDTVVELSKGVPGEFIPTILKSISLQKIAGTIYIPSGATPMKWNLSVTTPDGGTTVKNGLFTIKPWPVPKISTFTPTMVKNGTTVQYTLTGTNFQPGSSVTLINSSVPGLNFTASVHNLTQTKITGMFDVPSTSIGKYGIELNCPDGKNAFKGNVLIVK